MSQGQHENPASTCPQIATMVGTLSLMKEVSMFSNSVMVVKESIWVLRYPLKFEVVCKVYALVGGHKSPHVWEIWDLFLGGGNGINGGGNKSMIFLSSPNKVRFFARLETQGFRATKSAEWSRAEKDDLQPWSCLATMVVPFRRLSMGP